MEIWKQYSKHYEVSNLGRVRSKDKSFIRSNGKPLNTKGRLLKGSVNADGYKKFWHHENGIKKLKSFHVAIAEVFLEYKPNGTKMVVDHINEDKLDNRVANLRIISNRENISKSIRHKGNVSSTGYIGVHQKPSGKYYAKAIVNGKQIVSKVQLTADAAHKEYKRLIS